MNGITTSYFFYKCKMVESKMAAIKLKMAIFPFRLNLERVCVMFYGSINSIEYVKLPSVNYLDESKMATSKMAVIFDHYIGRQQR